MTRIITFIILAITMVANAQNSKQKPCATEEYEQFSFWLGDWNVYDKTGKLVGNNRIVKTPNACAMQENWTSKVGPSQGTSYNFYNKADKKWHQVWVDNTGFSLFLKGSYADNKMTLKSDIIEGKQGKYYNRVTWTKNEDGSVLQLWEILSAKDVVVQEAFRGLYKKKE